MQLVVVGVWGVIRLKLTRMRSKKNEKQQNTTAKSSTNGQKNKNRKKKVSFVVHTKYFTRVNNLHKQTTKTIVFCFNLVLALT